MSKVNLRGYETKTQLIIDTLSKLVRDAYSGQHQSSNLAKSISYECETLLGFLSTSAAPPWIAALKAHCDTFANPQNNAAKVKSFEDIFLVSTTIKTFDWNKFFEEEQGGFIDFDGLYARYKKESKLDEALEKVIACLEVILAEPSLSLSIDTKENIQTIISTIRRSKNASLNAVHATVVSTRDLLFAIAKLIPKLPEAIGVAVKVKPLLENGYDALGEVYIELNLILNKLNQDAQRKFHAGFSLPPPAELKLEANGKEQLLLECGKEHGDVASEGN